MIKRAWDFEGGEASVLICINPEIISTDLKKVYDEYVGESLATGEIKYDG